MRPRIWAVILMSMGTLYGVPAFADTLSVVQNLNFGTWIPTPGNGSVTVSTSGTTSTSGVSAAPSGTSASQGILKYTGSGLGTLLNIITLAPQSSTVTLTGGTGGSVTVGNFVPQTGLGINLLNPSANIPMGGKLNFSGSPAGTFTGSVQVVGTGALSGTATALLPISVTFWRTLAVNQVTHLNFGAIETRGGNAVVRVAARTGIRSIVSGGSGVNLVSSPVPTAGQFSITGQPNTNVTITLPSSITITGSNGGAMTVNNFTKFPTSNAFDSLGNLTLKIGANLGIASNQTAGTYTGSYQITVSY